MLNFTALFGGVHPSRVTRKFSSYNSQVKPSKTQALRKKLEGDVMTGQLPQEPSQGLEETGSGAGSWTGPEVQAGVLPYPTSRITGLLGQGLRRGPTALTAQRGPARASGALAAPSPWRGKAKHPHPHWLW